MTSKNNFHLSKDVSSLSFNFFSYQEVEKIEKADFLHVKFGQ